jgi:hypothetical protein
MTTTAESPKRRALKSPSMWRAKAKSRRVARLFTATRRSFSKLHPKHTIESFLG